MVTSCATSGGKLIRTVPLLLTAPAAVFGERLKVANAKPVNELEPTTEIKDDADEALHGQPASVLTLTWNVPPPAGRLSDRGATTYEHRMIVLETY
jgi:hypothetical protein